MIHNFLNQLYSSNEQLKNMVDPRLIELIEEERVCAQVYRKLKAQGSLEQKSSSFQIRLTEGYKRILYHNLFIKHETDQLLNTCESIEIEVVPLKGVYFAEKYYGDIGFRETTDIDLLVREENVQETIEIAKRLGFVEEEAFIPGHFHISLSKPLPASAIPLTVEIHWGLMESDTSSVRMGDFWSNVESFEGYSYVRSLSLEHTFYFMCLHAWRHNLDSIKHYLDIIQIIEQSFSKLNMEEVFNLAKSHQTYKRVLRTLSIVYDRYPFLQEEYPMEELPVPWFRRIEKYKWGQLLIFFDYQVLSYDSFRHRIKEAIRLVFTLDSIWKRKLKTRFKNNKLVSRISLHRQRTND